MSYKQTATSGMVRNSVIRFRHVDLWVLELERVAQS